jgi:hypothetical protein
MAMRTRRCSISVRSTQDSGGRVPRDARRPIGHGIVAGGAKWMAPDQSAHSQKVAADEPMASDRLRRVVGARRLEATGAPKEW